MTDGKVDLLVLPCFPHAMVVPPSLLKLSLLVLDAMLLRSNRTEVAKDVRELQSAVDSVEPDNVDDSHPRFRL